MVDKFGCVCLFCFVLRIPFVSSNREFGFERENVGNAVSTLFGTLDGKLFFMHFNDVADARFWEYSGFVIVYHGFEVSVTNLDGGELCSWQNSYTTYMVWRGL